MSVNFASFDKKHLLVVNSNKVTPKFYIFIILSVIYLLKSSVAVGGGIF